MISNDSLALIMVSCAMHVADSIHMATRDMESWADAPLEVKSRIRKLLDSVFRGQICEIMHDDTGFEPVVLMKQILIREQLPLDLSEVDG